MFCLSVNAWFEVEKLEKVCVQEWKVGGSTIESKTNPTITQKHKKIHPYSLTAWRFTPFRQAPSEKLTSEAFQEPAAWRLPSARLALHQKTAPVAFYWYTAWRLVTYRQAVSVCSAFGLFKCVSELAQSPTLNSIPLGASPLISHPSQNPNSHSHSCSR